jgi:asparagine synthase (glutamine-hydrolysing)
MCGIAGYLGKFSPSALERMLSAIQYRGPDGQGVWYDRDVYVGLGHLRLSIIDLSETGSQPMVSMDGGTVIVYNGELYNYRELRAELIAKGYHFRGHSDTEVILNLYLDAGEAMLPRLNGMFAFAIWDKKRGDMLLARDGYGVKPLYVRETPQGFLFASEIKAILAEGTAPAKVNPTAILRHLTFLWSPAPETYVRDIYKLEPGESIRVREGRIVSRNRFYEMPVPGQIPDNRPLEEVTAGLRDCLQQAVRRQMVSDVPVGAFLSGGLDSSSIVAYAARETNTKLPCFTIDFDDGGRGGFEGVVSDLHYAKKVAGHLNVDLNVVRMRPPDVDLLADIIHHLDEPVADLAPVNAWHIAKLSRECGIKVLLGGAGGDDLLTGYRRHYALQQEHYWAWLPQPARALLANAAQALPNRSPLLRRASKAFRYAGLSADERLISYFYWLPPATSLGLLSPDLREGLAASSVTQSMRQDLARLDTHASPLQKLLYLDCRNFLADHNLLYTDRMTMAHGVEARVPFMDHDFVSFAANIPERWKQNGRTGKWIFKKAMEGILPNDVIYRPKTGFGLPLREWLHGPMQPLIDEHLSPVALNETGLFDAKAVAKLIKDDSEHRYDAAYSIWSIVTMQAMVRRAGVTT